ncbi:MAG: hypothetical protein ACMXYC_03120 [Candidatus Woesearchaeota archaeon]
MTHKLLKNQNLGFLLIAALIIQHVFPIIQLGSLHWIATAIVLLVAILLLLK